MFWPFNKYPGSDYETFNYDWIIGKLKELKDSVAAALASEEAAAESAEEAHGKLLAATVQATRAVSAADNAAQSASEAADSAESIASVVDQVNTNTGRIDNLIATAGDGTVPSELTDMRVNYEGKTFSTAGASMRESDAELKVMAETGSTKYTVQNTFPVLSGVTAQGITLNALPVNGYYNISGTNTGSTFNRLLSHLTMKAGHVYKMHVEVSDGEMSATTAQIYIQKLNGTNVYHYADEILWPTTTSTEIELRVQIAGGAVVDADFRVWIEEIDPKRGNIYNPWKTLQPCSWNFATNPFSWSQSTTRAGTRQYYTIPLKTGESG